MKHILLTILFVFLTSLSFADKIEVIVKSEQSDTRPRYLTVVPPTVTIDDELFTLSLQFAVTSSVYTVIIKDTTGLMLFQQLITSSQTRQTLFMPMLPQGNYSITIESGMNSFSGEFEI